MEPTRSRWGSGAEPSLRAALFWVLLVAALAVPLWNHQLEFGGGRAEGRCADGPAVSAASSNRAAVCVAQWLRSGRLTGFSGRSPAVCLRVPAREWASLSVAERDEVWRDIGLLSEVSRSGRPVFVRDEEDHVIVTGMCRDVE
jgi:hypothetical protein